MEVTFTAEGPDQWENVIEALQAKPGEWAYIEDIPRKRVEWVRRRFQDLPIDIRGRGLSADRSRFAKVWLRWKG